MRARSRALGISLFAASLPLVVGFGICGGSAEPPPEPRGCDDPAPMSAITALELGSANGAFTPSAQATSLEGGQGFAMLGYRIAVQATEPVGCIALSSGGRNLSVQPSGDWLATDTIWVITGERDTHVVVEAYGMRVERTMSADADAGPPSSDGGGAVDIDATASDAPPR